MYSEENQKLAGLIIKGSYLEKAQNALKSRENRVKELLSQRVLPEEGWDDLQIECFLQDLACMDTNNFLNKVGVGEREGRVFSGIVNRRHFGLAHGIGRSGEISAEQPKAAGSSLMLKLCVCLAKDALFEMGIQNLYELLVLPLATGMSISLVLQLLKSECEQKFFQNQSNQDLQKELEFLEYRTGKIKQALIQEKEKEIEKENEQEKQQVKEKQEREFQKEREKEQLIQEQQQFKEQLQQQQKLEKDFDGRRPPRYVIWPRIDQKTCLKCIQTAGLIPVVIEGKIVGDRIETDLDLMDLKVQELGAENIVAVLSTTSCFAPRVPDKIIEIGKLCKRYGINHVINNAYGLQSTKICNLINQASAQGRVDIVVQSTDKNFMVPVGGSIVFSVRAQKGEKEEERVKKGDSLEVKQEKIKNKKNKEKQENVINKISEFYPGRACSAPVLDLFITLLQMGKKGLKKLLQERQENFNYAKNSLQNKIQSISPLDRVLETPENNISIAISLKNFQEQIEKSFKETKINKTDEKQQEQQKQQDQQKLFTQIGSVLYQKRVMGSRVVTQKENTKIANIQFLNYGSNHQQYPFLPYINVAVAIGSTKNEIDQFLYKFEEALKQFSHNKAKN